MLAEKKIAVEFLKKHKALAEEIDFMKSTDMFISEMEEGLTGNSSIPMLPTYLSLDNINIKNEKVIVIDAGGTNFRVALVSFDENGKIKTESFNKHRMPGTSGEISADAFFEEMAALIKPVINESDKIGFCFSYPLEMTKNKDGKIMFFSKEVNVNGAKGRLVGKGLLDALGIHGKKIVLLNDTVAALLAGVAGGRSRSFGSYAGFILGTGTNTAYIEACSNIKKDPEISKNKGNMIINMESGSFGKIHGGYMDELLTNSTKDPDNCRFEKMISGAYFGMNLYITLKVAASEGLFSDEFARGLEKHTNFSGAEIDGFFNNPYGNGTLQKLCKNEADRLLVYYLAENVTDRAAKLAAINIAAVVKKSGAGENPLAPMCITAEGTTFHRAKFLKNRIEYYLDKYLTAEMNLYAELLHVEDATVTGTAIAAMID